MTVNISKPAVNVREKLAELDKPTGIAGEAMLRAETPQEQFNLIGAGRRNLLINGGFTISQRGDYTSATSITNNNYYLDRWNMDFQGMNAVIENNTADLPNGNTVKTAKIRATGSGTGYMQIRQKMEVESWMDNQTITMSVWVRSNTAYPRLRIESGSGVTGNNLDGSDIYSGSGEWEKLTFTTPLKDGLTGFSVGVVLWNGSTVAVANNDYMEIAQFQLELGKVATPFEHRSYGDELQRCQRYYQFLGGTHYQGLGVGFHYQAGQTTFATISYPNEMRASPSVSIRGTIISTDRIGFNDDVTSITSTEAGKTSLYTRFNTGTSRTDRMPLLIKVKPNTTSGIQLDAEL